MAASALASRKCAYGDFAVAHVLPRRYTHKHTGGYCLGSGPRLRTFDAMYSHCLGLDESVVVSAAETDTEVHVRLERPAWWTGDIDIKMTTGVVAREGTSSVIKVTIDENDLAISVDGAPYAGSSALTEVILQVTSSKVVMKFESGVVVEAKIRRECFAVMV